MKTSITYRNNSRTRLARFGRIVSAATFGLLIGAFAVGPARADDHHGGHDRGHEERHEFHGRGYVRGPAVVYGNPYPDYYYAPEPNYYDQPEPYDYGYYPPPEPDYYPPQPSEGINLFFGL